MVKCSRLVGIITAAIVTVTVLGTVIDCIFRLLRIRTKPELVASHKAKLNYALLNIFHLSLNVFGLVAALVAIFGIYYKRIPYLTAVFGFLFLELLFLFVTLIGAQEFDEVTLDSVYCFVVYSVAIVIFYFMYKNFLMEEGIRQVEDRNSLDLH